MGACLLVILAAEPPSIADIYNEACREAEAKKWDDAIRRFEDAAVAARPPIDAMARYNLAWCHFEKGRAAWREAEEKGEDEKAPKLEALKRAAEALRTAREFFEEVRPRDEDTERNIEASKAALRAVLDRVAAIEEAEREKREKEALRSPGEMLDALRARERLHRRLARGLAALDREARRDGIRRLRASEAERRALAEKLAGYLAAYPGPGDPKEPPKETVDRYHDAAKIVREAVAAQREVEVALLDLDAKAAVAAASRAIEKLREARARFPFDPAKLVARLIPLQSSLVEATESAAGAAAPARGKEAEGGKEASKRGPWKGLLDTLKDRMLAPLAKALRPPDRAQGEPLAEEEHEVVWGASILAGIEDLQAKVRKRAADAREAATRARDRLAGGDLAGSLRPQREALAALEAIRDLLPKPPKSPVERLRELLERQKGAKEAIPRLKDLEADARAQGRRQLAEAQTADGREAGEIAKALEGQPPPQAKEAAKEVRKAEGEIHGSSEALRRDRAGPAGEAVDRAIASLRKALDILSGKKREPRSQGRKKGGQGPRGGRKKSGAKKERRKGAYALSPREARLRLQEMDRKRREEEAKIRVAPSKRTVDKDW